VTAAAAAAAVAGEEVVVVVAVAVAVVVEAVRHYWRNFFLCWAHSSRIFLMASVCS